MPVNVSAFVNERDRDEVVAFWIDVFAQDPSWNEAQAMIDRKLKHLPELSLVGRAEDTVIATLVVGRAMMA